MAVTFTRTPGKTTYGKEYEVVKASWTSDGSGDASGTVALNGWFIKGVTDPTDGPTANYDITLVQDTADQLGGTLVDRHTTNGEAKVPSAPIFLAGDHTFTVAAAGATKSGVCWFWLVQEL